MCQISFCGAQFLFGIFAPDMQTGNPRRFLQHLPPFLRFGGNDRADAPLTHQSRRMRAGRRVGKDQRDVLCSHIAAIGAISRPRTALDAPGYLDLMIVIIGNRTNGNVMAVAFCGYRDLGKVAGWARGGASEDHIFHTRTAHRFRAAFAHHPADGLQQVGFAATIRANNAGQSGFDAQFGGLDKAFKAGQFQPLYAQGSSPCA